MSAPVFICPAAAEAAPGAAIALVGPEARHAIVVQRRTVGETLDLVDGRGTRARGVVEAIDENAVALALRVSEVMRDPERPVVLVQALAKGGRDEAAVETCTELGATRVIPWAAERSIVQWSGTKAEKARQKWENLTIAAAKQSRRAWVPTVDGVLTSRQLAVHVREAVGTGAQVLVLHEDAATALVDVVTQGEALPSETWLIVGPEGGIGEHECQVLTDAGATAVRLGPHVLRASSAGPAGLAVLSAVSGAWS